MGHSENDSHPIHAQQCLKLRLHLGLLFYGFSQMRNLPVQTTHHFQIAGNCQRVIGGWNNFFQIILIQLLNGFLGNGTSRVSAHQVLNTQYLGRSLPNRLSILAQEISHRPVFFTFYTDLRCVDMRVRKKSLDQTSTLPGSFTKGRTSCFA